MTKIPTLVKLEEGYADGIAYDQLQTPIPTRIITDNRISIKGRVFYFQLVNAGWHEQEMEYPYKTDRTNKKYLDELVANTLIEIKGNKIVILDNLGFK